MDNLFIKIVAKLNKAFSKKRIKQDIGELENTPFCIRLIGAFNKTATRARLKQDVKSLSGSQTISVNGKIDKKSLRSSLKETKQQIEKSEKSNPVKITADIDVNADRIDKVNQVQNDIISGEKGIRTLAQSYVNWNRILDLIIQSAKKAVDTTTDLAKAQTDLQIVTGKSNEQMKTLMNNYNQMARNMSSTTLGVAKSANELLRTGKSIADTNELVKDSIILSRIGDLEESEATKYLISTMNGYKFSAENVIDVIDKLSAVELLSASDSGELAEAISKTANVARTAGVEFDTLISYLAVAKDITQDDASAIGNAFKSIFTRLQNIKIGKFLDEEGNDISQNINDAERVLSKFNISLRDNAKEFRNAEDVIADVASAWKSMSSVEQAAIKKAFSNSYQTEKFTALLENYDKVIQLVKVSQNSAGTSMERFSIYEKSLEAATNRLTTAFESLAYNTISSDFLKKLAIGAAGIIEVIDKFKLLEISLSALAYKGAIKGLLLLGAKMVSVKNNLGNLSTAMNLSTITTQRTRAENVLLGQSYSQLTPKQQKLILSNKKLNTEQRLSILTATGLTRAQAKAKLQTIIGLITATGKATKATVSLKSAWNALKLSIANNPIGLIAIALSTVGTAISTINRKQQELVEKAKEASEALKQETDTIDDYADKVFELRKKLDEGNLSLEESKNIRTELKQIQDDLIDKYGDEADGIDLVTGSIEKQIEALYNLKKANFENTYQENKQGYDAAVKQIREKRQFNLDGTKTLAKGVGSSYSDEVKELRFFIQRELTKLGFEKVKESNGNIISFHKTSDSDIYTINEDLRYLFDKIEEYSKNGNDKVEKHANDILTYLSDKINETKPSKEIEGMYAQWLQYKSNYSNDYLEIEKKQNQLEQALRSENEEEIAKSREEFLAKYQDTLKKAGENGDTDVVNYLEKAFENTISAAKESSKTIKDTTNKTAIPAVAILLMNTPTSLTLLTKLSPSKTNSRKSTRK